MPNVIKSFPNSEFLAPVSLLRNFLAIPLQFATIAQRVANYSYDMGSRGPNREDDQRTTAFDRDNPSPLPDNMLTFAHGGTSIREWRFSHGQGGFTSAQALFSLSYRLFWRTAGSQVGKTEGKERATKSGCGRLVATRRLRSPLWGCQTACRVAACRLGSYHGGRQAALDISELLI